MIRTDIKVEVFKTNVLLDFQARILVSWLTGVFPESRINFDLDDCDHILRIEGSNFCPQQVIVLLNEKGFSCSLLD